MPFEGLGMGLGVWVAQDSSRLAWNSNPGEFGWGGVANTVFWIDPVSNLAFIGMIQNLGPTSGEIRGLSHNLVYQALVH